MPDPALTMREGAIKPWSTESFARDCTALLRFCARRDDPDRRRRSQSCSRAQQRLVLEGSDETYPGVIPFLEQMRAEMKKAHHRFFTRRYMGDTLCRACGGSRLRAEALAVRVQGLDLGQVGRLSVERGAAGGSRPCAWRKSARRWPARSATRCVHRLGFLERVGLGYLTLDRLTRTLIGRRGAAHPPGQRLGSRLVDTLYVLDEPTSGLHAADVRSPDRDTLEDLVARRQHRGRGGARPRACCARRSTSSNWARGPARDGGQLVYQGSLADLLHGRHPHRRLPAGRGARRPTAAAARGARALAADQGRAAAQPARARREDPARPLRRPDRHLGLGQEQPA